MPEHGSLNLFRYAGVGADGKIYYVEFIEEKKERKKRDNEGTFLQKREASS